VSQSGVLLTRRFVEIYGAVFQERAAAAGLDVDVLILENTLDTMLAPELRPRVHIAFQSGDLQRGNLKGFFDTLAGAPNLQWMQSFGVGIDATRYGPLMQRGVRITNAVGVNSEPIALHALTGLLMLSRRFPHYGRGQQAHEWRPINWDAPEAPPDLSTQTLVIVGLGAVGTRIGRFARELGLRVVGIRRNAAAGSDAIDDVRPPDELNDVLPLADWLVLSCTLTPETRGLIDARRLAMMPRGAHLINVARGEVVVEPALIEALQTSKLGGAYLDVFAKEPLSHESPLWDMPNVIVSPHNAAASNGKFKREADFFLTNLERWARKEPLLNEVTGL
jgi:phosphoglycerate dehydrogenase-like enzyme